MGHFLSVLSSFFVCASFSRWCHCAAAFHPYCQARQFSKALMMNAAILLWWFVAREVCHKILMRNEQTFITLVHFSSWANTHHNFGFYFQIAEHKTSWNYCNFPGFFKYAHDSPTRKNRKASSVSRKQNQMLALWSFNKGLWKVPSPTYANAVLSITQSTKFFDA